MSDFESGAFNRALPPLRFSINHLETALVYRGAGIRSGVSCSAKAETNLSTKRLEQAQKLLQRTP
jgi:hypothetical protein